MKVAPFQWDITPGQGRFWRYQPEVIIGIFNQVFFFILLFQIFFLARKLFDAAVAWTSVVVLGLSEQLWEFTTSGLSTMLVMVLFTAVIQALVKIEGGTREPIRSRGYLLGWSAITGLLIALLCLTRYSMGWLIIPVLVFLGAVVVNNRTASPLVCAFVFLLAISPWLVRNYMESKTLFGTAGYAVYHQTTPFPDTRLDRLMPKNIAVEINKVDTRDFTRKFVDQTTIAFTKSIPELGGTWIWAFFLVGLLVPFINPALSRLRYFVTGAFLFYCFIQAMGVTEYSDLVPIINSENLLILFLPLLTIFATAFFYILLDQLQNGIPAIRTFAISVYIIVLSMPLILLLLPPKEFPFNYPPYYPPNVQQVSHWMQPDELMMADMPWAVAWYGQRQSVWVTLDVGMKKSDDFYRINDFGKTIRGVYLTPISSNGKYLTEMRESPEAIWSRFYLDAVLRNNLPTGFPLTQGPSSILPDQLFLSDRPRWPKE
jgi:hypothetical protein